MFPKEEEGISNKLTKKLQKYSTLIDDIPD